MKPGYPGFGELQFVGDFLHVVFFVVVEFENLLGGLVKHSDVFADQFVALPDVEVPMLGGTFVSLLAVRAAQHQEHSGITDDVAEVVDALVIVGAFGQVQWVFRVEKFGFEKFVEQDLFLDIEVVGAFFAFEAPSGASAGIEDFAADSIIGVGREIDVVAAVEALVGFEKSGLSEGDEIFEKDIAQ